MINTTYAITRISLAEENLYWTLESDDPDTLVGLIHFANGKIKMLTFLQIVIKPLAGTVGGPLAADANQQRWTLTAV